LDNDDLIIENYLRISILIACRRKWKMENGKWKMENGKWKMENLLTPDT